MTEEKTVRRLAADLLLIACLLACGALLLLLPHAEGATVTVTVDGETVARLPLAEDCVFPVRSEYGYNLLTVREGRAAITEADCPGGDCRSGGISRAGECIVCLPHRLLIRIDGERGDLPDAVTGGRA